MGNLNPEGVLPRSPVPPVLGVRVDVGVGKTRAWRERVAPALLRAGRTGVLAVPRHRLGDEIVRDLARDGFTACVYRGREADDPERPGDQMCQDLARVSLLESALAAVGPHACQRGDARCDFFDQCGYQRQRRQRPAIWVVPHQLLFRERPSFIPEPDSLTIDEAFWQAAIHGVETPYKITLVTLGAHREVSSSGKPSSILDALATADLNGISRRALNALGREPAGRIRRAALIDAGLTADDLRHACRLEWRRKQAVDLLPGQPMAHVETEIKKVAQHNKLVARLARFWDLLARTVEGPSVHSPWLELRKAEMLPTGEGAVDEVVMSWRDDIHESWGAPTLVMDATLPVEIVKAFFPTSTIADPIPAPMPHTWVRQITDRAMTADMLIPTGDDGRENARRRANVERLRRFLQVRSQDVSPGRTLLICQQGLEEALRAGALPANLETRHFNDITGENAWKDVALVIVVGRTLPPSRIVERNARVVFGTDVEEVVADADGHARYPLITRGMRRRDGRGIAVMGPGHPDSRVEAARWAICEAQLVQAIGRARGVNRTADNPLKIDILTNIVLPIEVDEVTTWERIQPGPLEVMRAAGAVPSTYADMAAAYPDLFPSGDAARMAINRGNPEQTPIEYLIGVCSGFSPRQYRRKGARGPWSTLFYDPARVDPLPWLTARLGAVTLLPPQNAVTVEPPEPGRNQEGRTGARRGGPDDPPTPPA
jgi:putative DNA primase/helicase